ncbi:uncharacterized protein METZ01_LOCUS60051 [marine metagenome]|jgi:hypothetical protein|uniref:DUF6810 domain-containing protein n=1 Tax=marine metagenome TaxID=408172 RepID=A0A381SXS2_9ZZZZ|tara:strand:+ start:1070 stop:1651 length:582 start_codon:yes stop_codon:yes gene_type:complete
MVWIRLAISKLVINVVLVVMVLMMAGCGSDASLDEGFVQIRTAPDNYTVDDLKAFGFKTSKHYDVEGLPDGLDAWKGFWGLDPYDRHDYEIRFYASHDLAVSSGKPIAIESTGEEFEASRETQTWTEGLKDRWQAQGVTDISGGASRQSKPRPTYPNWAILGNMVILCDGLDSEQALIRCGELIDNFLPSEES